MKITSILLLISSICLVYAEDAPFSYIHSGGNSCESSFTYSYYNTYDGKVVKFSVDFFVRPDADRDNALLFFFENVKIPKETTASNDTDISVSVYPIRVTYDENGKVIKYESNADGSLNETGGSLHLKSAIVNTMQLDWKKVQENLNNNNSFFTKISSGRVKCKVSNHVKREVGNPNVFTVMVIRNATDCKSEDSSFNTVGESGLKTWKYQFTDQSKNFQHLKIHFGGSSRIDNNGCAAALKQREWSNNFEEIEWKPLHRADSNENQI